MRVREGGREGGGGGEREGEGERFTEELSTAHKQVGPARQCERASVRERGRERERDTQCVCVCVRERERGRNVYSRALHCTRAGRSRESVRE